MQRAANDARHRPFSHRDGEIAEQLFEEPDAEASSIRGSVDVGGSAVERFNIFDSCDAEDPRVVVLLDQVAFL